MVGFHPEVAFLRWEYCQAFKEHSSCGCIEKFWQQHCEGYAEVVWQVRLDDDYTLWLQPEQTSTRGLVWSYYKPNNGYCRTRAINGKEMMCEGEQSNSTRGGIIDRFWTLLSCNPIIVGSILLLFPCRNFLQSFSTTLRTRFFLYKYYSCI